MWGFCHANYLGGVILTPPRFFLSINCEIMNLTIKNKPWLRKYILHRVLNFFLHMKHFFISAANFCAARIAMECHFDGWDKCTKVKNVLEKPKIKVARNRLGKVWKSQKCSQRLPGDFQDQNGVIFGRHLQCWWRWSRGNQPHLDSNLKNQEDSWKMWLIAATSPPPVLEMATIYHPNSVLGASGKSLRTFLTFPDLPRTISDNFDFGLFGLIFHIFRVLTTQSPHFL